MLRFMMVMFLITRASITRMDGSEGKTQHGSGGGLPRGRSGHSTQGRFICYLFGRSGHSTQGRLIFYPFGRADTVPKVGYMSHLFGRAQHSTHDLLICTL